MENQLNSRWIEDGSKILFFGDSITDCGRTKGVGPLGDGYVKIFSELVASRLSLKNVEVINQGIGGNRITDLLERWERDVLPHEPQNLVIQIGINDLWGHLFSPTGGVSPELFKQSYEQILSMVELDIKCRVALITPFLMSKDFSKDTEFGKVNNALCGFIIRRVS